MNNFQIYRFDILTHKRLPLSELISLVKADGTLLIDVKRIGKGRHIYIINDKNIIKTYIAKGFFKRYISDKIKLEKFYQELNDVK